MSFEERMMGMVEQAAQGDAEIPTRYPGRFCCVWECPKEAEFEIQGLHHFEDQTDACTEHVGELLGTPDWLSKDNTEWSVRSITRAELVRAKRQAVGLVSS